MVKEIVMKTLCKMLLASSCLVSGMAAAQSSELTSLSSLPVGVSTVENGKTYSIVSLASGKCWDVADHSVSERGQVQQWDCHGGDNQKFLATLTYKSGFILTPVESGIRLQIADNNLNNGARLIQAAYAAGNNGYFFVRPTATEGLFTITANHTSKCLDVIDHSLSNGARIQQWDCHGQSNQTWILIEE
jgi:cytochrome c